MKKKTINIGFPIEYEDDDQVCHYGLFLRENEVKAVDEKLQELQRKDNIINELKRWLIEESEKLHKICGDNWTTVGQAVYERVLDKIKELEENK